MASWGLKPHWNRFIMMFQCKEMKSNGALCSDSCFWADLTFSRCCVYWWPWVHSFPPHSSFLRWRIILSSQNNICLPYPHPKAPHSQGWTDARVERPMPLSQGAQLSRASETPRHQAKARLQLKPSLCFAPSLPTSPETSFSVSHIPLNPWLSLCFKESQAKTADWDLRQKQ